MSIIIRLKDTGEVFNVIPGFRLEIKDTSPFFNNLGSKSVTTTLPRTPHNMRLLGFSNRIDLTNKPRTKMEVIVSVGSYVRDGMLYQSTAYNTEHTFGIIIAFNEGIMYEAMSDILLTQLSNLPILTKTVPEMIDYMDDLFTIEDPDAELSVFELNYKKNTYTKDEVESLFGEHVNGPLITDGIFKLNRREKTFVIENNKLVEIDVPEGYGITPFVRVWRLLELIFKHFGYTVIENPFKDHFQLKRLCVLNNTVDAIVTGILDYRQLLPPVTISAFLQSLYTRFGMKVFFNSNTNEVSLVLIRDILQNKEYQEINISSLIDKDFAKPKQIKLSAGKSLDMSSTETETFEEFLAKYNNMIGDFPREISTIKSGGVYYDIRAGLFYQFSTINDEKRLLSSIHFDWNKKVEGIETEEIVSIDECLSCFHSGGYVILYYGIEPRLMNLILSINGQPTDLDTTNMLAFAYDMGEVYFDEGFPERYYPGYKFGSIFPFTWQNENMLQEDREGNVFTYALTFVGEHGAFNNFFKEYDAFFRHANQPVKFEMHPNTFELSNLDFSKKRILDGQPLLFDKVDHQLGGNQSQTASIEARTLRLLEPYDLEKEHHLPVPDDILYMWVHKNSRDKDILDRFNLLYTKYSNMQNASHIFVSLTKELIEDPNPPTATTFWFLPPTEIQFTNNSTVGYRSHTCTVEFVHIYETRYGSASNPQWETHRDVSRENIKYYSWFEPDLIS